MRKKTLTIILVLILAVATFILFVTARSYFALKSTTANNSDGTTTQTGMANPASVYCGQQGGKLGIRNDAEGSQYGVCVFPSGLECDEWKFYRGECSKEILPTDLPVVDIKSDTELIKLALVEKDGINLDLVDVVISKDTGKYASGGIKPKQEGVGGAYVFAAKTETGWKIVASGNGTISCESLKPYPDFPKEMISECIDASSNPVQR